MVNTGILPQHQGKGIYSALLLRLLGALQHEGFQIVYSRHVATNNQVLIPKLKAGFVITSLEVSRPGGVGDPWHARKHVVRNPGGPASGLVHYCQVRTGNPSGARP